MPETIALTRLAFIASRKQLIGMAVWLLFSTLVAMVVGGVFGARHATGTLCLLAFPVFAFSLGVFDFSQTEDLMAGKSGYSHWILRMPIASWKLALVPLTLRFVWNGLLYLLAVLFFGIGVGIWLPISTGLLCLAAGGAWVSVVIWRPFEGPWRRVTLAVVAFVGWYLLMMLVMSAHFDKSTDIPWLKEYPFAFKTGTFALALFLLVWGVWLAFQSVVLSRTNTDGIIPEKKGSRLLAWRDWGGGRSLLAGKRGSDDGPLRWLVRHDLLRGMAGDGNWALTGVLVAIFVLIALMPLHVGAALFLIFLVTQIPTMTSSAMLEPTKVSGSSLPSYLAASPMTCAEIGFARGIASVAGAVLATALVSLAFLLAFAWPANQVILRSWMDGLNSGVGNEFAAYRWGAVGFIACVVLVVSRSLACTWPTATGRSRLALVFFVLPVFILLAAAAVVAGWFVRQADWETATASFEYWATWVPALILLVVVCKGVFATIAAILVVRERLLRVRTVLAFLSVWSMGTVALAAVLFMLVPDQRILLGSVLLVTLCLVPLGRILMLPYAVFLNRYR
ncbi:hypothetical protein FF011L_48110 [Roseimaritima multifibrata]|uniref:Uncharacterized protein n=1 Tax=Roseimaritima multifibrata TaxID=1930274 RepID=A0A517MMK0_9BACT|nr:hypothetical protein [Roseimaritima multifibrata]QDS96007.1 hypothetical protein FF011L_48110 [Roseimaritima multifibrata]